jgi:membrane peptidoglycan carboxypeptidase
MGIIANKGMRLPVERIDSLHFAAVTPYETRLEYRAGKAERVLKEEVAEVARRALMDVVEAGTARRFSGGFVPAEGVPLEVGGKTGTGDHRYEVYGRGGRLLESRVVNRSATFVFFMGDRYFGTITAYVPEPHAAKFRFTSSLTVQLLKSLTPALKPLVRRDAGAGQSACAR